VLSIVVASALGLVLLFGATWLVSVRLRNVAIVDVIWGPAFALVAWVSAIAGDAPGSRPVLVAIGASIWGLRLGGHLLVRAWGEPEDRRYASMRDKHGRSFAARSLYLVFGLQAVLALVISVPLLAIGAADGSSDLGVLDAIAGFLWAIGLAFESVADEQLRRFRADPANEGAVLDTGLWAWSRHPNYFGDLVVWCGFGAAALAVGAWWSLVGVAIMGGLLAAGTGKPLLERSLRKRRPAYADYVERTSGFVPWPPSRD
jgi:steroid 5-alpha reductase family enzyme